MNIEKKFNLNLDILRIIACLCVAIIHVTDSIVVSYTKISPSFWHLSNIIEGFIRCAVPIFFMISGALLLSKDNKETPLEFYKKRFKRMFLLYIAWVLIYILYMNKGVLEYVTLGSIWDNLNNFNVYYNFWVFKPLLITYLCIPVIRIIINHLRDLEVIIITGAWVVLEIIFRFIDTYEGTSLYFLNIGPNFTFIGYMLIGYIFYRLLNKKTVILKITGAVMFIGGSLFTMYLMYKGYNFTNDTYSFYPYLPTSFNIFMSSTGLFILINAIDFKIKNELVIKIIRTLSKISFGVFLIHPILITELNKRGFSAALINSRKMYIMTALIVCIGSFAISYIISKIPVLKKSI